MTRLLTVALADHRCALTVKTAGLSDLAYWGTLWEVAVELVSICARHGMQGREVRLGRFAVFTAVSIEINTDAVLR